MTLSERLDRALAKRNLASVRPMRQTRPPTDYETVQDGLKFLHRHHVDEDGIGCFVATEIGLDEIQLPMKVGGFVVEDIQQTKSGNYQVHFRKSEFA